MGYSLLAASWLLRGHILIAEMILSVSFLAVACCLVEYLNPFAGMLLASTAFFYTCFGMETSLFLRMLVLCVLLYVKEQYFFLPLACTLTTLTRFEGGLMALILLWLVWREKKLPPLRAFIVPAILSVSYLVFNFRYYGKLLPSSTTAKFLQGKSQLWGHGFRAFFRLNHSMYDQFALSFYIIPAAVILAAVAAHRLKGSKLNKSVLPFLVGLLLFYVLFNIPDYDWYLAPFAFFGIFYAVMAVPRTKAMRLVLAVVIAECTITGWITLRWDKGREEYVAVSRWLNANTAPNARVAAIEIGTVGFYCNRYLDDLAGLTNPKNAVELSHQDFNSWIEEDKPDYVIVHNFLYFNESAALTDQNYIKLPVQFGPVYVMKRR
jgi:arabinofuranosyltransferase